MGGTCGGYGRRTGRVWSLMTTDHDYAFSELNGVRIAVPSWGSS